MSQGQGPFGPFGGFGGEGGSAYMVPIPLGALSGHGQRDTHEYPAEIVMPPRVSEAMAFVRLMQEKTQSRIAPGPEMTGAVEFKGEKLSDREETTYNSALEMIQAYFDGKLEEDQWETIKKADMENKGENKKLERMMLLECPMCEGQKGVRQCPLCEGSATLLILKQKNLKVSRIASNPGNQQNAPGH